MVIGELVGYSGVNFTMIFMSNLYLYSVKFDIVVKSYPVVLYLLITILVVNHIIKVYLVTDYSDSILNAQFNYLLLKPI